MKTYLHLYYTTDNRFLAYKDANCIDAALQTIHLIGIDRLGLLNEVTQVLSRQLSVNMHTLNINCEDNIFDAKIELFVHDRDDVHVILEELKQVPGLQEIKQIL